MTLIKKLSENRICILMLAFAAMFLVMAARLYSIQIKNGQSYAENAKATVVRTIQTPSIRGNIYDKYGRVLAENKVEYNLMLDLSVKSSGETENILALIEVMERFGIEININDFPIKNYGGTYQFDFTGQSREKQWKTDMGFRGEQMDFTAGKTVEYLSDYFGFDDDLAGDTKIKLMAVMCRIHLQRYRKYQSVTVSENIDRNFISYIEEHSSEFSGIYVGESWYRYYPYGECMANIIGYTGNINEDELEEFESYGYKESDKIGKTGIEKSHELFLRGKEGKKTVEVDAFGARVSEFDSCPAQRGKDIYLSIDAELQKKIYDKLKESLKSALFDNINSGRTTVSDIMASLADNNIFNWNAILEAQNGAQLKFKNILLNEGVSSENTDSCGSIAAEKIKSGAISQRDFVDCLIEQKIITPEKTAIDKYESGAIAASELILNSILNDEIGINRVNMDPSTGSAVVEDVNTGKILAMVSFPSYDNNRLANEFDSDYYNLILSDKTSPLINRPAMERKAPGSVFKMLSAAVGRELLQKTQ